MNRLEFLKEMKHSLLQTVQSVCAPFVEEKIEKLDRSIDVLSQIQWWHVTNEVNATKAIETKFIDGQVFYLFMNNKRFVHLTEHVLPVATCYTYFNWILHVNV